MVLPDFGLLSSTSVTVLVPVDGPADGFGEPTHTVEQVVVQDVLPEPVSTADLGVERPDGVRVDMRFHWPKASTLVLRGCSISYAGNLYEVIGNPQPYVDANVPGPWDRKVDTRMVDG